MTDIPQIPLDLYLPLHLCRFRKDKMQIEQGLHMKTELGESEARFRVPTIRNSLSPEREPFDLHQDQRFKAGGLPPHI